MMPSINAIDIAGAKIQAHYDEIPDICPVCHRGIQAVFTGTAFVSARTDSPAWTGYLELLFRCPRQDCARAFLAIYRQHVQTSHERGWFFFQGCAPTTFESPEVEDAICRVSPSFVQIYGQSLAAERLGLDQICGCGLRRALEFLIKDYLIQKQPTEADSIKKTFLGTCISNYITDANIKAVASRATWLGNDETHYEKRYEQLDIKHLKELIRLTLYWMGSELLTEKYTAEMAKK
jgi:hypothetical protein